MYYVEHNGVKVFMNLDLIFNNLRFNRIFLNVHSSKVLYTKEKISQKRTCIKRIGSDFIKILTPVY